MNIPIPRITRKRGVIIASFAILIVGLAGGTLWLYEKKAGQMQASQQKEQAATPESEAVLDTQQMASTPGAAPDTDKPAPQPAQTPKPQPQPGIYQTYNSTAISNAGNRNRVLFFHAPWCPQCRQLEADIKSGGVPKGIAIFKIDYDSNQNLRQRYGVTQQTTVVRIDAHGNKINSFLPYSDPTLTNALNGLGL